MLHKAKKSSYACDVIRKRTLYTRRQAVAIATSRHCLPSSVTLYRSPGCAYGLRGTLFSFHSRDLDGWSLWSSIIC